MRLMATPDPDSDFSSYWFPPTPIPLPHHLAIDLSSALEHRGNRLGCQLRLSHGRHGAKSVVAAAAKLACKT
jgi:hypothetical protein